MYKKITHSMEEKQDSKYHFAITLAGVFVSSEFVFRFKKNCLEFRDVKKEQQYVSVSLMVDNFSKKQADGNVDAVLIGCDLVKTSKKQLQEYIIFEKTLAKKNNKKVLFFIIGINLNLVGNKLNINNLIKDMTASFECDGYLLTEDSTGLEVLENPTVLKSTVFEILAHNQLIRKNDQHRSMLLGEKITDKDLKNYIGRENSQQRLEKLKNTIQIYHLDYEINDQPAKFTCLLSEEVMTYPAVAPDGFTYEKSYIEARMKVIKSSPRTGEVFKYNVIFDNHDLFDLINEWLSIHEKNVESLLVKLNQAKTENTLKAMSPN